MLAAQLPGLDGYAAAMKNVRMIANTVKTTYESIKQIKEELYPVHENTFVCFRSINTCFTAAFWSPHSFCERQDFAANSALACRPRRAGVGGLYSLLTKQKR